MKRLAALLLSLAVFAAPAARAQGQPVRVGSKADTETTVLAEIAIGLLRSAGLPARFSQLEGGTPFVWKALLADRLDVYPEYTGTLSEQIFARRGIRGAEALRAELARLGLGMTEPLGFANNYALGMRRPRAEELGIRSVSDLRKHAGLRLGFSHEFLKRADGWPGLRDRYGLPQKDVRGLEHSVAYEALLRGAIDVTDLYTTDAEIRRFDLLPLRDDLGFFPLYEAVLVYRLDLEQRSPGAVAALRRLEGRLTEEAVIEMNGRAQSGVPAAQIAADFLHSGEAEVETPVQLLLRLTGEHLTLVGVSLAAAVCLALPLGIVGAARPRLGRILIGAAGIIQTIPSLALLVLMIPVLKTGFVPAIAALFLYSLLPILNNTATGLRSIPPSVRESAEALGLSPAARLWLVELPLASPAILAGIKTSAVINIGTATLGAIIGAGGYGQPIMQGVRMLDERLILLGALPAAALALAVQGLFELAERFLVPRGLRLRNAP
jgi:osmoprotectant transport system permease protein